MSYSITLLTGTENALIFPYCSFSNSLILNNVAPSALLVSIIMFLSDSTNTPILCPLYPMIMSGL
jgi:hypothetical protein